MKTKERLKYVLVTGLLAFMFGGCRDEAPALLINTVEEPHIAITLRIPYDGGSSVTRAYPTGGPEGDGREDGLPNENSVADANIFFFEGSGFNPEIIDPASIDVTGVYVDDLSAFTTDTDDTPFEKKLTIKVRASETKLEETGILSATDVGFITILNAGADLSGDIHTLKELREYSAFTSSRTYTAEDGYKDFLMTTAYDTKSDGMVSLNGTSRFVGSSRLEKNISGGDKSEVKWVGETTVQRVCARVDLMYKSTGMGVGELLYFTPGGNQVHVTNILPVNFMQQPSYLLTKVTSALPTKWTESDLGKIMWGGVETTVAGSDRPANYVIEPNTLAKAAGTKRPDEWYGVTASSAVKNRIAKPEEGKLSSYLSVGITAADNNGNNRVSIIGYPDENIQAPSCYNSDFITGLILRATFQPGAICRRNGDGYEKVTLSDAAWHVMKSKTLWRYQPTSGVEGVREADALYFTEAADVEAYSLAHPSDLATVTRYDDGVCYYNLWLRHYNDESYLLEGSAPKSSYPMEFAIVRNNIYRVSVSFTGPGDPSPTLREPDTMMSRIFVRKWNQRVENNPLQF